MTYVSKHITFLCIRKRITLEIRERCEKRNKGKMLQSAASFLLAKKVENFNTTKKSMLLISDGPSIAVIQIV